MSFVETNDSLFEAFKVVDLLNDVENVIFELFLLLFLFIESHPTIVVLFLETALTHAQIIHNQFELLSDAVEHFHLQLHAVHSLVKRRDCVVSRAYFTFQLPNFVVKYKFEFLKLLRLLFQVNNLRIFLFDGVPSLSKFAFLRLNLIFEFLYVLFVRATSTYLFCDFRSQLALVVVGGLKGTNLLLQVGFCLACLENYVIHLVFVSLLQLVDCSPRVIFNSLPLLQKFLFFLLN